LDHSLLRKHTCSDLAAALATSFCLFGPRGHSWPDYSLTWTHTRRLPLISDMLGVTGYLVNEKRLTSTLAQDLDTID